MGHLYLKLAGPDPRRAAIDCIPFLFAFALAEERCAVLERLSKVAEDTIRSAELRGGEVRESPNGLGAILVVDLAQIQHEAADEDRWLR